MSNIWVEESFVNESKGYRFGDTPPYETFTDNKARLFRQMQQEYGRCTSAMYVEYPDGRTEKVGWVFSKRMEYEDARSFWPKEQRSYIREVWVRVWNHNPLRKEEEESDD